MSYTINSFKPVEEESIIQVFDFESIKQECDEWLEDYFQKAIHGAETIDHGYEILWRAIKNTTMAGGKRIRPYLFLLSYVSFGGEKNDQSLQIAAIHELLHQFLLIHDDVIDRDYVRHGEPNVAGQLLGRFEELGENGRHFADSAAILAGDLLQSDVYRIINESPIPSTAKRSITCNVHTAIQQVAAGELMDVEAVIRNPEESDPINVAKYKTASYSFVLPLLNGAALAGASEHECEIIQQFGTTIGIAYQIQDDILGLFGDEDKTGKSTMSDLREGKHTLLIQLALKHGVADEKQIIKQALGNAELTVEQADVVRNIIRTTGSYDMTSQILTEYIDHAALLLNQLAFDEANKHLFSELIDQLTRRQS